MLLGEEATREEEKKERDGLVSLRHLFQPYALLFLPPPPPWMVKWAPLFPPWNLLLNSPPLDLLRSTSTHCRLMKIMIRIMIANTSSHLVLPFKLWISSIKSLSRQALSFYFLYIYIYILFAVWQ